MQENPKAKKLPLVYPIIIYNGKKKYTAPRSIWDLFPDPQLAEECFTGEYRLINLSEMSDDQLMKKPYLGLMQYLMAHIHARDSLKMLEEFFKIIPDKLDINIKEIDQSYLIQIICYTMKKITE